MTLIFTALKLDLSYIPILLTVDWFSIAAARRST
jgi:hypothetical protein